MGVIMTSVEGQHSTYFGVFTGPAYYLGDLNYSTPFRSAGPSFGALLTHNFNPRYALKTQVSYAMMQGKDALASNQYQQIRNASFSVSLVDAAALFEFNFKEFKLADRAHPFSPYFSAGLGCCWRISSNGGPYIMPTLPFAGGIKIGITNRLSVGLEYSCRKLFSDQFDGIQNFGSESYKNFITNNDWYTLAGIFVAWKVFDNPGDCPAYW